MRGGDEQVDGRHAEILYLSVMDPGSKDDQPTCGNGLAQNAVLPAKLAELLAAQAEVLERHMKALDGGDSNAQAEREAYTRLASAYTSTATELASLAEQMASYRDMPMPRHDPSA